MKGKIRRLNHFLFLAMIIVYISGCTGQQNQSANDNNDTTIVKVHTSKPINQTVANQAKEKIIKEEEVSAVKAVNTDKELLMAIKVDQFHRFQLKKIKKNVKTDVEKAYPDYIVLVSTDQKIYWELEQLEEKLQKDKTKKKTLNKEFNNIKNLMKEKA